MKKTIYLSLLAGCLATLSACDGPEYEVDNLFPEQYHKILYASKSGKQIVTLYDVEEPDTYTFSVVKSGSDPILTAGADIHVMTQEEIDSKYSSTEGVNYKILGTNAYSIDVDHVDFNSDDKYKLVNITLNPQVVKAAIENSTNISWILPLKVSSQTDSVNVNKNELILQFPTVLTPTIGFDKAGIDLTEYAYGRVPSIEKAVPFLLDANVNRWEIGCQFGISEDYIDTYNQANGTYFQILPEGTYSFTDRIPLIKPDRQANQTVKVNGGNLPPGDFMLPLGIKEVSQFIISPTKGVYAMALRITAPMLDRTGWTIEANTEELTGELGNHNSGPVDRLLDGKEESFWHSAWKTSSTPLPHELIIDTKEEYNFTQIRLVHRQQFAYVKSGEFYISSDKVNWEKVGNFTMPNTLGSAQTFGIKSTKGKYIKIKIISSNNGTNSALAEVYVYGAK